MNKRTRDTCDRLQNLALGDLCGGFRVTAPGQHVPSVDERLWFVNFKVCVMTNVGGFRFPPFGRTSGHDERTSSNFGT